MKPKLNLMSVVIQYFNSASALGTKVKMKHAKQLPALHKQFSKQINVCYVWLFVIIIDEL